MRKTKKKKEKFKLVDSRHQLHALLDIILTRASETGEIYSGKYRLPLSSVIVDGKEGQVNFEVEIYARCNGRFINEDGSIEVDSDKRSH